MKLTSPILFTCLLLLLPACDAPVQHTREDNTGKIIKESLVETNQYIRQRNRDHIIAFSKRAGWELNETATGLWYEILEEGDGTRVGTGKYISYSFETRLLTGKLCYSRDTLDPQSIVVGKGNIEAGLEEGLLLLNEGSKARFMIPPYLAHGNFGDRMKIPGSAVLWIEVNVLNVKR